MRHFVTPVTARAELRPRLIITESEQLQPQSGPSPARKRGFVMTSTITTAVTFLFILAGFWAADLVCYHPQAGLDPLSPVSVAVDWN
jgi:hypothetical protein